VLDPQPVTVPRVLICGDVINDVLVDAPGELVLGDDNPASIQIKPGGSAANQAAWMASLGLDVVFAGRAGAADADFHRAELARFGVRPKITADPSAATGSIVVLIGRDGERTMITDRGANRALQPADVPESLLDGADLLHLTGYTFFAPGPRQVARSLIAAAKRRGIPFTLDPSSAAFLSDLAPADFLEWTADAEVCFPNLDEAMVLTNAPALSAPPANPRDLAAALAGHYKLVALKLGPNGAVLATRGSAPVEIPAVATTVRDTTGAGDAFCAGFVAAWLGVNPSRRTPPNAPQPPRTVSRLIEAASAAAETAARAVSTLGGRPG
jgi:sugar/nucleoside kinase (ribokinase family)